MNSYRLWSSCCGRTELAAVVGNESQMVNCSFKKMFFVPFGQIGEKDNVSYSIIIVFCIFFIW
jgi:hypothetical protein